MRALIGRSLVLMAVLLAGCGGGGLELHWTSGAVRVDTSRAGASAWPAIATLSNGDFVVAWSYSSSDGRVVAVRAQRFAADGAEAGTEQSVNRSFSNRSGRPAVAPLRDGGYVIAWISSDLSAIDAQRFDERDERVGDEWRVNDAALTAPSEFGLAGLEDGGYVVAWSAPDGSVWWRRVDAADVRGEQERVTSARPASHSVMAAGLTGGGFVVAWTRLRQDGSGLNDVVAQRVDSAGSKRGTEQVVNGPDTPAQDLAAAAGLAPGGYAIVWTVATQYWPGYGAGVDVHAQRFDSQGERIASPTAVNAAGGWRHVLPAIASLSDGGWLVAWQAFRPGSTGWAVRAQRFDAGGGRMGSEIAITDESTQHEQVAAAGLAGGGYVLGWTVWSSGAPAAIEMIRYDDRNRAQ